MSRSSKKMPTRLDIANFVFLMKPVDPRSLFVIYFNMVTEGSKNTIHLITVLPHDTGQAKARPG